MACCKPCCGCQDCEEGQEGKCCCGGVAGICCQPGEYCVSGVCEPVPCCCSDIALNDLLYGTSEYSWPNVRPAGTRTPDHGAAGSPPTVSAAHCTDPITANDAQTVPRCCDEPSPGVFAWTCGWKLRPACLRWLCRCVDGEGGVICSQAYGGPTENDISLTDLALEHFGAEAEAGCYVYTVEFFGWHRKGATNGNRPPQWVPRDDVYSIYKTQVTNCP